MRIDVWNAQTVNATRARRLRSALAKYQEELCKVGTRLSSPPTKTMTHSANRPKRSTTATVIAKPMNETIAFAGRGDHLRRRRFAGGERGCQWVAAG